LIGLETKLGRVELYKADAKIMFRFLKAYSKLAIWRRLVDSCQYPRLD
jgi:hypothetical protein